MGEDIEDIVFAARPKLKEIYEKYGTLSLFEYAGRALAPAQPLSSECSAELLSIIKDEVKSLFDETTATEFAEQIAMTGYVSTVDHHGPLSHPSFFHGNFVQALANHERGYKFVPIFSTASVSLDNHTFPRGFVLHSANAEKRLPFFTDREKHLSVFGAHTYTKENVHFLNNTQVFPIPFKEMISQVVLDPKLFTFKKYRDQGTFMNHLLWKKIFPETKLIMLPIEKIVSRLLSEVHFKKETLFTELCATENGVTAFEKFFDGVPSAFNAKEKKGTFLFWGMKDGKRIRLFREGMSLVSEDKTFQISLSKEDLMHALQEERLMPSLALCLLLLSCHYGLTLGGGYSQIDYLPKLCEAFQKSAQAIGGDPLPEMPALDHFGSDFLFLFLKQKNDILVPATTLDYLKYRNEKTDALLRELVKKTSLAEAIRNVIPDIYTILTRAKTSYTSHVEPILSE